MIAVLVLKVPHVHFYTTVTHTLYDLYLPLALVFLAERRPLFIRGQVEEAELEGAGKGDDHRAGVVGIHIFLDLGQPAKK